MRLDRIEELRKEREQAKAQASAPDHETALPNRQARKRKRAIDVLESDSEESSGEDDTNADDLFDWRAKRL